MCYVTPAEHLALPNLEDVKQGIMASKIAAHAADIAKGVRGARQADDRMAQARRNLDWEAQWSVPWIRRRQNGSGMRESLNMRILVPCAENSVRCEV